MRKDRLSEQEDIEAVYSGCVAVRHGLVPFLVSGIGKLYVLGERHYYVFRRGLSLKVNADEIKELRESARFFLREVSEKDDFRGVVAVTDAVLEDVLDEGMEKWIEGMRIMDVRDVEDGTRAEVYR